MNLRCRRFFYPITERLGFKFILILCASSFLSFLIFSMSSITLKNSGNIINKATQNNLISGSDKPPRIVCYILIGEKSLLAGQVIKETWGSKCHKILFFGGFSNGNLPITRLSVVEGYEFLWGKTKSALIHLEEFYKDYDWFLKADSDTFVIIENLTSFVRNLNQSIPLWTGYKLSDRKLRDGYMSGGAGYVFNRRALESVVKLFKSHKTKKRSDLKSLSNDCDIQGNWGIEDQKLGRCFFKAGTKVINSTDAQGRERFLPIPISALINGKISSFHWIWRQSFAPIKIGPNCCSPDLISIHQVSPNEMRTLYFLIYQLKLFHTSQY